MQKIFAYTLSVVAGLLVSGSGFASTTSWWMLCDWCESDANFQYEALNAPGEYTSIYVTNRETNETRKFDRIFIINDFVGGVEQQVFVTTANFPDADKLVFEQAVEGANTVFISIPRADLAGVGGLGDVSSVVGDISVGSIDNRLINSTILTLEVSGRLPSRLSVNDQTGLSIVGSGGNVGAGETIRVKDLVIEIEYPDGSILSFRRRGGDGEYTGFSATDADGDSTNIDDPPNGTVNIGAFVGRDFDFGGASAQSGALGLMDFLSSSGGLQCSFSTGNVGGLSFVTVRCQRP